MDELITVFEVGPRDGIQALKHHVSYDDKIDLIKQLVKSGITNIEVGAFVHPKLVPNMAESDAVYAAVQKLPANLSVLVPNKRGVDRAKSVGADLLNIFYSPNDVFNVANYGRELDAIIAEYKTALEGIQARNVRVYISMAFGGPPDDLDNAVQTAMQFGEKVVLCDTDGIATPEMIKEGLEIAYRTTDCIALHLHHGPFLFDNVQAAIDHGVKEFDTSIGGLGGCPFIPGSEANLATEDFVAWCNERDIECGIESQSLKEAVRIAGWIKNPTRTVKIRRRMRKAKHRILNRVGWML